MNRRLLAFWIYPMALISILFYSVGIYAIKENLQGEKTHMHIEFKTEGGIAYIPGLSQPTFIDSKDLSKEQLEELQRLITEARFFDLPPNLSSSSPGAADYQKYTITIEQDGRQHTVHFTDTADNPALKKLFAFLNSLPPERQ